MSGECNVLYLANVMRNNCRMCNMQMNMMMGPGPEFDMPMPPMPLPPPSMAEPLPQESAWERGLRTAKEVGVLLYLK